MSCFQELLVQSCQELSVEELEAGRGSVLSAVLLDLFAFVLDDSSLGWMMERGLSAAPLS